MVTDLWKPKTINLIVPRGWHCNSIGCGGINSGARVGDFFAETLGCEFQGVLFATEPSYVVM